MKMFPLLLLLAAATPTPAADPPAIPTPPVALLETIEEKAHCTQAGVEINRWAKKLRLESWSIQLICGIPEIPEWQSSFVHGASHADTTARAAIVWVNPKSNKTPRQIVIHELLHLVVAEVREAKSVLIEERLVRLMADLLHEGKP